MMSATESAGTAKEAAVQTQPTTDSTDRVDRLAPVPHAAAPKDPRHDHGRSAFTVDYADAAPHGDVEVRYALDPVANVWVASFLDEKTGEVVKTVPATRVMHQLAELRSIWERSIDKRA